MANEGINSTASGFGSHAEGINTRASGVALSCRRLSDNCIFSIRHMRKAARQASGSGSALPFRRLPHERSAPIRLMQRDTEPRASGVNSHAEGYSITASGTTSHAEGSLTTASGFNAHAEGERNTASGNASRRRGRLSPADQVAPNLASGTSPRGRSG